MNNIYELEKTNSSDSSREKTIIRTSIIGIIANVFLDPFHRHRARRGQQHL